MPLPCYLPLTPTLLRKIRDTRPVLSTAEGYETRAVHFVPNTQVAVSKGVKKHLLIVVEIASVLVNFCAYLTVFWAQPAYLVRKPAHLMRKKGTGDEGNRTLISAMRPRRAPVTPRPQIRFKQLLYPIALQLRSFLNQVEQAA